jgi:uncharacterized protein YdhG (YjbR/CyaY superfamily)
MNNRSPKISAEVDGYIATFPAPVRGMLEELRQTIRAAAPDATEKISYGMPAYHENGMLAYFAGYKNHIGFYPLAEALIHFKAELSDYKTSKGTVQFPLSEPLPVNLIYRMVEFRAAANRQKQELKKKK